MPTLGHYAVQVRVNSTSASETPDGYVRLANHTEYALYLRNDATTECDAKVTIDDKPVGTFRIAPQSFIIRDRPVSEPKKFHFVLVDTAGAGLTKGASANGLISVEFSPAVQQERSFSVTNCSDTSMYLCKGARGAGLEGGTALSGHSDQQFVRVPSLDYDYSKRVNIHLRLVGDSSKSEYTPLQSTRIPPHVDSSRHFC